MPTSRRDYSERNFDSKRFPGLLAEIQQMLPNHTIEFKESGFEPKILVGKDATTGICKGFQAPYGADVHFSLVSDATKFQFRFYATGDLLVVSCTSSPPDLSLIDSLHEMIERYLGLLPPNREEIESTYNLYDLNKRVVRILKVVERWEGSAGSVDLFEHKQCFVSFHFDEHGTSLAYELRDFLEIIGIRFVSGQGYEPRSVSEKVLSRIDQKIDLFIVIFTRDEHVDWLQQEIGVAKGRGIPIMVLIEEDTKVSPGLLADHEYVRFPKKVISKVFFPLVQALRYLDKKPR